MILRVFDRDPDGRLGVSVPMGSVSALDPGFQKPLCIKRLDPARFETDPDFSEAISFSRDTFMLVAQASERLPSAAHLRSKVKAFYFHFCEF